MQFRTITTICIAALVSACGDTTDSDDNARAADQRTEAAYELLSEEEVARLAEQYPRLGDEPLPEPRPRPDADPASIPERVLRAANGVALASVTGEASFYANRFEGRRTASGIPFRQNQMVAAHRSYPFGTILRVTNLGNDRSVNVRVVDRGPFGTERRILDLSRRAAQVLGYESEGRARVRVQVLEWGRGIAAM